MNINIISRLIQGLSALLILILIFALCAEDTNVNTNAVVWISCMLIGIGTIVEFCKDLKEPNSDEYP